jgi:hypothetical protein
LTYKEWCKWCPTDWIDKEWCKWCPTDWVDCFYFKKTELINHQVENKQYQNLKIQYLQLMSKSPGHLSDSHHLEMLAPKKKMDFTS